MLHWMMMFVLALGLVFCANVVVAQDQTNSTSNEPNAAEHQHSSAKPTEAERPMTPYRAEFAISELQDGKKINSRHYSMLLNVGDWNDIKIGTKVPVATGQGTMFQYMDVGTSIRCKLMESGNEVAVDVRSDFSNFSSPEEARSSQPTIRQVSIEGNTVVSSGKPVVIGVVDDPSSDRQFQLDATVTKLATVTKQR